jgi:DNA (cytosine-5)-methyltransferase 1
MARDYKGFGNQDMKDGRGLVLETHVYENHAADSRIKSVEISPTVTSRWGTGGGNVPIALAENTIGRQPHNGGNGDGFTEGGPMYTLNCTGVHGVVHQTPFGVGEQPNTAHCLRSGASRADKHESTTYIAQPIVLEDQGGSVINTRQDGIVGTLRAQTHGHEPSVVADMAVRRLTPVECERLQGFPDNYTNIKENCPDGPRYKALGNSMAVPVMSWIGKKIQKAVDCK